MKAVLTDSYILSRPRPIQGTQYSINCFLPISAKAIKIDVVFPVSEGPWATTTGHVDSVE